MRNHRAPAPQRAPAPPPSAADAFRRGARDMQAESRGVYFAPGVYVIAFDAVKTRASTKPGKNGAPYTAVDVTILKVLEEFQGSNRKGEKVGYIIDSTKGDIAFKNFKAVALCAYGIDPYVGDVDAAMIEHVFGEAPSEDMTDEQFTQKADSAWNTIVDSVTNDDGAAVVGALAIVTAQTIRTSKGAAITVPTFKPLTKEDAAEQFGINVR